MVTLAALWLSLPPVTLMVLWKPIIAAAVLVFVASSVFHMVLPFHKSDFRGVPDEEAVRAALRKANPAPGQYMIPWCGDMKEMRSPEMLRKMEEGPVAMLTVRAPGQVNMGSALGQWFVYCLAISFFSAYLTGRLIGPGAPYPEIFRAVGTVAFLGYAGATASSSIWLGRPWSVTIKDIVDGLVYALLTAGTFGWLWPR